MTDRAVHLEEIQIHRVLGIHHGDGFTVSGLSSGVNLIHGPNGAGKSTTARVIQELLWPGRTGIERPTVAGQFQDGDAKWRINIDAGYVEASCNGTTGTVPAFGPPENRHRYHLTLPELIIADNASFAKAIADASQGGYDLEAAADSLGFTDRPSSPRSLAANFKVRRDNADATRRRHREIEQAGAQLRELREQRLLAIAAAQNIALLTKAGEYQAAKKSSEEIQSRLNAIPKGVIALRGDERDDLNDLAKQHEQLERDLAGEQQNIRLAEKDLATANLSGGGLAPALVARLRSDQRRLRDVESDLRQQHEQLAKAEATAQEARERLGDRMTDEQLAACRTVEVGDATSFATKANRLRAQNETLQARLRSHDREEPESVRGLEAQQLRDGIVALSHWLASSPLMKSHESRTQWPLIIAASLILLLACVLAILNHWAWMLIALLAASAVLVWDWWLRRMLAGTNAADARAVHRNNYQSLTLPSPVAWDIPAVADLVSRLTHLESVRAHEDERLLRLGDARSEANTIEEQLSLLEQERVGLQDQLGLSIAVSDEWLPLLIDNIAKWQSSSDEVASTKRVLTLLEEQQQTLVTGIATALGPLGYPQADAAETVGQFIDDLADRQLRHRSAVDKRTAARQRIDESITPSLEAVAGRRQQIFQRLEIDEVEEATVDQWLGERSSYLDLKQQLAGANTICKDRREALTEHEHLLELDASEIELQKGVQQEIASKHEQLIERITNIETDIARAKSGYDLSEALEGVSAAAGNLAESRDQCGRAVVGALLRSWVRTIALERSRPDVFERANYLLVRFTRGTLQLELDDHASPPMFLARGGSGPSRPVNQLSVGEHIQLLMAVRMAFLEQDEQSRLPLILDEALGTTDDGRAGVVIDTVLEIARQGRQIFYFTAQHDEVGKWIARLNDGGVAYKVFDLAETRHLCRAAIAPLRIVPVDAARPPTPDSVSHEAYGRVLGVPGVNPGLDNLDGLHLWHLIDDVHLLHELLVQRIATWGQLRTLLDHGGAALINSVDGRFDRVRAAARAIKGACDAWRVGRGTPVDREALLEAGCVSEKFIDELAELARENSGDAKKLMDALESGHVKHWRADNTERLREYLGEHGYLSNEMPLSADAIRIRTLAAVADDLRSGRIDNTVVERIIGSLPE